MWVTYIIIVHNRYLLNSKDIKYYKITYMETAAVLKPKLVTMSLNKVSN